MRQGTNPAKKQILSQDAYLHQVIVPVYLPHAEGYFKDGLRVLQSCMDSLVKTAHKKTFISVVNNGSSLEVVEYLQDLFSKGGIQELIHTDNIGKNNAILKALSGHYFDYITIADADVLFLNHWQDATMNVFEAFPKAGVVGLTPQIKLYSDLSYNVLFDKFFSKKLRFGVVKNPQAIKEFLRSIGWDENYNQDYLEQHLIIEDKTGFKAVVGSGHYVATYKREALGHVSTEQIMQPLSPKFDRELLDKPGMRVGSWRLTTEDNYAYHMGNVFEPWMDEALGGIRQFEGEIPSYSYKPLTASFVSYFVKNHLFRKLVENKKFINWFIKFKGLPKAMSKTPWHE